MYVSTGTNCSTKAKVAELIPNLRANREFIVLPEGTIVQISARILLAMRIVKIGRRSNFSIYLTQRKTKS